MNHLMIDIETLGTTEKAPVISIGAVFFDKNGVGESFYITLDSKEQMKSGVRKADQSTLDWWAKQGDEAKKVFNENTTPTKEGLVKFVEWIAANSNLKYLKPWGNGSGFDISILESIFTDYGVKIPWKFWNIRDFRTYKEFVYDGKDIEREGTHHNALDDAFYQAKIVVRGMNR